MKTSVYSKELYCGMIKNERAVKMALSWEKHALLSKENHILAFNFGYIWDKCVHFYDKDCFNRLSLCDTAV